MKFTSALFVFLACILGMTRCFAAAPSEISSTYHNMIEDFEKDPVPLGKLKGYLNGWHFKPTRAGGEFTWEIFADNDKPWSGDHGMDYRLVPGVLISNRRITLEDPALYDLTVAVLDEYGIPKNADMIGQDTLD